MPPPQKPCGYANWPPCPDPPQPADGVAFTADEVTDLMIAHGLRVRDWLNGNEPQPVDKLASPDENTEL